MANIYIKKNYIFIYSIFILTIFSIISYSKAISTNPAIFSSPKDKFLNPKENGNKYDEDIFQQYNKLLETTKQLENDINEMAKKNSDYLLKIEVNKIYIKLLYFLIIIFILIIIVIIIIKFYFQCKKKEKLEPIFDLQEKYFKS